MKPQVANNPYQNPFYNRFNDPCRQRFDDMQSHEDTLWLGEAGRVRSLSMNSHTKAEDQSRDRRTNTMMSLVLLIAVACMISAAFLLRS